MAKVRVIKRVLKHKCPYCKKLAAKRVAKGIFECKKCKAKFVGKAYEV